MSNSDYTDEEVLAALGGVKSTVKSYLPDYGNMTPVNIAKDIVGGVGFETPASMITGGAMASLGGLGGLLSGISGNLNNKSQDEKITKASNIINDTANMAYQPTSVTGKYIQQGIGKGMDWANSKVGMLGNYIDTSLGGSGLAGEAIGQATIPIAATLYGGVKSIKSASKIPEIKSSMQLAEQDPYLVINKAIKKAGNDIGLIAPSETGPKRIASDLSHSNDHLSLQNSEVATGKLANQVGIKSGAISDSDIVARQAELGNSYNAVRNALPPKIDIDTNFMVKTNELLIPLEEKFAQDPKTFGGYKDSIQLLKHQINQGSLTPQILMDKIATLRKDASNYFSKKDASPTELNLGKTNFELANLYEDLVESKLLTKTALLNSFRKARTQLSQIHIIEQARKADGLIDLQKLSSVVGRYADNKKLVTGNLKTVSDFANTFKETTKPIEKASFNTQNRWENMSAIGGIVGAPATGGWSLLATLPTALRTVIPPLAKKGLMQNSVPSYTIPAIRKGMTGVAQGLIPTQTFGANISKNSKEPINSNKYSDEELLNMINGVNQ